MKDEHSNLGKSNINDVVPESLPLLDFVGSLCAIEKTRPFLEYKILAVQHLLGTALPFFSFLEKGGAKPQDISIIGKAYSSHPLVVAQLQNRGYIVAYDDVYDFAEDQPYDSILEKNIINVCSALLNGMGENQSGLIIDDGGKAIALLHNSYSKDAKRFACVEQTSRGARLVSSLKLSCPVVNVARSQAKTKYESQMIAKAMVFEFSELLKVWEYARVYKLDDVNILLLGYGFVGEQVAKEFRKLGFVVSVYDNDENKRSSAKQDGFISVASLRDACQVHKVIIGCTGTPIITRHDLDAFSPYTLLVNMASTDTEFQAWDLRARGTIVHQRVLASDVAYLKERMPLPWRSLYRILLPQGPIYLANGGFPVDFSGKINPIPANDIQLTSALLLGGAIQSVSEKRTGLIDLDACMQEFIIAKCLTS